MWLTPGISPTEAVETAGLAQRQPTREAGLGLVLGAGNVTAIPVLDVVSELIAGGRVTILKLNPTMDPLLTVFQRALAPLIELDLLRIVRGGPEVGAYLTRHPAIEHVHITGSAATFNAIVWGTGADAARRRATGKPALRAPISAELGGVSPIIVVPGPWSAADLRFQAQHVVTMRLNNSGHNCVAGQVVIVSADWDLKDAFLDALRTAYAQAPQRLVWYPRAQERLDEVRVGHPHAEGTADRLLVRLDGDDPAETTEYFAPVLAVRELPGLGQAFLEAAVDYANDRLTGTLGANVLIDPATEEELGGTFEDALEKLRYGSIAVNAWTGTMFALPTLPWGPSPAGHSKTSRAASARCTTRCCWTGSSAGCSSDRSAPSPEPRRRTQDAPPDSPVVRRLAHNARGERRPHPHADRREAAAAREDARGGLPRLTDAPQWWKVGF